MAVDTDIKQYLSNYRLSDHPDLFSSEAQDVETVVRELSVNGSAIPVYINEYWTSKQRQSNALHEIPYRACFKAQLPHFFIDLFTKPGDTVYDPFAGRGTTAIEAGLQGRGVVSNDVNPLSHCLTEPRLSVPPVNTIEQRLDSFECAHDRQASLDLSMFYHPDTESEIICLRDYLLSKQSETRLDPIDNWIKMVATSRLTGHSTGFFSVYTLPPNQAVTQKSQKKINERREQTPEYKPIRPRILKKSKRLIKDLDATDINNLKQAAEQALFLSNDSRHTQPIKDESISLTVTSPPFLDVVNYSENNWLRCWFNGIDGDAVEEKITTTPDVEHWVDVMQSVFDELYRITEPTGWVAFEVGEIRDGAIKLDEHVVPLGINSGFNCEGILINQQEFTKTSNIWGVENNSKGTNTNRVVLFNK